MQVRRHLEADLHRSITDASAAVGIARYLLERVRDGKARDTAPSPTASFYRTLRSVGLRRVEVVQQLQALLPQVQPELVRYTRHGVPDWIIDLLALFPTAADLARASVGQVDAVKTVLPERARELITEAATSVASLCGPAAAANVRLLIQQIRELDRTIAAGEQTVRELVAADPLHRRQVALLLTIPGIGERTAYVLSLELGDVQQFRDDRALTAWCGLDPHEDRSGDGVVRKGISHRGNAHVRRALFMPAMTAVRHLPAMMAFFDRLRAQGKPRMVALVACMHKLLRIAFAILRSGAGFDPQHEATRRQQAQAQQAARSAPAPRASTADDATQAAAPEDLTAPVTKAEAQRRRERNAAARAKPQCEVGPQRRGAHGRTAEAS
jgi:transposase